MKITHSPELRLRLAQLASHLVVALIALVVIGGATRVMEAGLACPDWPLCFGTLLPGRQMNMQVFLEWFHRLDAFLVGIALFVQFALSFLWRSRLPAWLPWAYGFLTLLVLFQGALGALTVLELLPSFIVVTHLLVALTLVAAMSAINQKLLSSEASPAPVWWRLIGFTSLLSVTGQSLLGSRMATSWAAQRCLLQGESCQLLNLHRNTAIPVTFLVLTFILSSFFAGVWIRRQWPLLFSVFLISFAQVCLGIMSIHLSLNQPLLIIGHQMLAALLVALLSALCFKSSNVKTLRQEMKSFEDQIMEPCHG